MKIVIPTADYPPIEGGISTVTVQVARELAGLGHEVTVIAPYFLGQEAFDCAEPVRVVRYRGYGLGWARLLPMLAATWPLLRGADLVLGINVAYGGLIGRLAQRWYGTRYATFAYAYEFLKFSPRSPAAHLLRGVYAHADAVVAISRFTRDKLAGFGVAQDRIALILPGAPPAHPISEEAIEGVRRKFALRPGPVILAVGRFIARKGHLTLVQAMPRVLARIPDAQLVLVGQGPAMRRVLRECNELDVRGQVLLPGRVSDEDVAGLYQACTVFALPTGEGKRGQVEGFGLVFTEAHAYGKPVVAGASGGVTDAVLEGETGLVVPPEDPEALAAALLRILGDPAFGQQLGENGRRRVETELNWRRFTERLLEALGERQ